MIAVPHDSRHAGAAEGERQKLDALALLEARRECYVRRGRRALLDAVLRSGAATADDVWEAMELPPGIDPRCLGSIPGPLARAGIVRPAGFVKSRRPERHASYIQVWQLADRAAALRWLATHPDLPDPPADDPPAVQGVLFPAHPTNEPGATAGTAAPGMEV